MLKDSYHKTEIPLSGVSILSTLPIKEISELNFLS